MVVLNVSTTTTTTTTTKETLFSLFNFFKLFKDDAFQVKGYLLNMVVVTRTY